MRHVTLTSSQSILEDLLKTEELEDGEIDSRMESQSAFVWAESRVELHAITAVDLDAALVVLPHDAELDYAFRDRNYL